MSVINTVPVAQVNLTDILYDYTANINLVALTPYTITIPDSTEITDVSLYDVNTKDVSNSMDFDITTNQVVIESNVSLNNLELKVIYKK